MVVTFVDRPLVRFPLLAVAVLALQTSFVTEARPFGVVCDLVLLLAVASGLTLGSERGALAGFALGLAFDLVLLTPFGLSALTYGLVGFTVGYVQVGVARAAWWIAMLVVAAASAGALVVFAVLGTLLGLVGILTLDLVRVVVVVATVNGLLAPVALRVVQWALLGAQRERA